MTIGAGLYIYYMMVLHLSSLKDYVEINTRLTFMVILTDTNEWTLPLPVRSYIDGESTEYNYADDWKKIAHIAYRVKRGVNLLPSFIEDIERHKQYVEYEYNAKCCIAHYIERLRTDCESDTSYCELPKRMIFTALFQLLTQEILYRYWEHDSNDGNVECYFDEVHYNYSEIASRFNGDRYGVHKYLTTSKETLRKIDVTESNIRLKNGWRAVAELMDDTTVYSERDKDQLIYPGDKAYIQQFNNSHKSEHQYITAVPPMPFSGNLMEAKVVILTLNPGYVEALNKDYCLSLEDENKKCIMRLMRNALLLRNYAIYGEKCTRDQGEHYWEKAFAHLARDAYGQSSEAVGHPIYHDIAFLQLIGYHSVKFRDAVGVWRMPSMIFTSLLVKYLATKTDKTFLVLRSERRWREMFGVELWAMLEAQGRIITKGHRGCSQHISRGNIKKDNGYDRLVNILKNQWL